jgi:hypothetical protein
MWGWIVLGVVFTGTSAVGWYLSRRWGRGSQEGAFEEPLNEVQDTTPRKLWP